ncbi:MAG: hypothetical protein QOH42_550 [Blastocatellia bacterium]|nr:hypothetical protein [Blastocatellia bacterium]
MRKTKRLVRFTVAVLFIPLAITTATSQTRRSSTPVDRESNATADAVRAPSNEIRCRGYSRPGGSSYVFFTINSRPSPTGETIVTSEMAFTPSVKAAGSRGEGLRPGECGFVDRPIGDRGPFRIRFETVANAQLKQKLHGSAVDSSPTAAERYPDVQTIPAYLRDPNHYWRFYISNPNSTFFMATGNGFWKPGIELVRPADSIRDKDDRHLLIQKKPE